MHLDAAVADTSALLAIVGAMPLEPPDADALWAPDGALLEAVAVLRSFHDGRTPDVLGDLAVIGPMVSEWISAHVALTPLVDLAIAHPDQLIVDLTALAVAKVTHLPLVTGQPDLVGLDPDVAVVVLPRRT